ncbi:MAG: Gamma-glutamylputrescine oxidoreductase [Alphaproteobacteria bacterium MarineAlpha5_Bin12]|nr:FAD-dependent oxidoreductase [Pelagibacteraceae bacterium]PPR41022.1 MAG: Gamma-glutamylputrescine oxidoreductase [Alphaproteobacteria bacterium MarineAlpha5_Bin12]|tara:strand:- start:3222 stop:4643 length:1422 start_codon:yes stop_codon:yes gene_type:complete
MEYNYQSPWFIEALQKEKELKVNQLDLNLNTDICIIGGGFTGLWTAIKIKEKKPESNIIIIEKDLCGSGASGRNGGCMIPQSTKFQGIKKIVGLNDAKKIVVSTEAAVNNIKDFCVQNNIDAQIRDDGVLYGATNKFHKGAFESLIKDLKENGINSWERLSKEKVQLLTGSKKFVDGYFSPIGGSLQPALLVRGLKKTAENKGVKIFEKSAAISYNGTEEIIVKTKKGSVNCKKLIIAMNAWTPTLLPFLSRSVILVSSDMIITETIKDKLQDLGLNNGLVILDSNLFTHYCRTTPDGKIILGKGGNTFSFRNKVINSFDGPSTIEKFLKKSFKGFYPSLSKVKITKSWNGPSERTKTGFPFFGYHPNNQNISYAFGYSGNGVLTTYVGGEILSSMALDEKNEWTKSNFCKGPIKLFPPEPFRWLGAILIRNAVRRKEKYQEQDKNPLWIDSLLAKVAVSVGRVDFNNKKNKV